MSSDYARIRQENERRYGTDIGRIGKMLLADRYDDRTHFIFELLQNAEDALGDRRGWTGSRAVRFDLGENLLRFSHYGKPFEEPNVRGICGIDESTKNRKAIGRFGIGFKSVYAYTSQPEIHSGDEAFAIENYVWPMPVDATTRHRDETVIRLPLDAAGAGTEEISTGLRCLGPTSLLFLREIEEIEWKVANGPSGIYLRSKPEQLGPGVRRIRVIGQQVGTPEIEESWLIFFRDVAVEDGTVVGQVEIAFSVADGQGAGPHPIQPVATSPLVVFFPTVVQTQLGFLVQGPYRTTPSRDNIIRNDSWNQHLVNETTSLFIEALHCLRNMGILDTEALRVLPLNRSQFSSGLFAPMFDAVRAELRKEKLLPCAGGGHVPASRARLARSQELRELFLPRQLADLYGEKGDLAWLSGDITQDRTPALRQYLIQELEVAEVTPETALPRLTASFLEAQIDEWIVRLYEFLKERPALLRRVEGLPLVRLADGQHVTAKNGAGKAQAFLPSNIETGFPTVRKAVSSPPAALMFLRSLGLREADPVDDVIINVLPKYRCSPVQVGGSEYAADFQRIVAAYRTDSTSQRTRLIEALRDTRVIRATDAGNGKRFFATPGVVYIATERLSALFAGVEGVLLVDDSYECLRGESVRDLLVACGASRYLRLAPVVPDFSWEQRAAMRRDAGCEDCTYDIEIKDGTIGGLAELLATMPAIDAESAANKAMLLWEALTDLEDRSGAGVFEGTYTWMYHQRRTCKFGTLFVRALNEAAWVPANGSLHRPAEVLFDAIGWKANPFLQSKILFKLPIIAQLAKEAGISPGVLDLLKRLGVTSEDELRRRLGVESDGGDEPSGEEDEAKPQDEDDPSSGEQDDGHAPGSGEPDGGEDESEQSEGGDSGGDGDEDSDTYGGGSGNGSGGGHKGGDTHGRKKHGSQGGDGRKFISYIGTDPDDDEYAHDPDGLDRKARMALEDKAISLILSCEPELQRTPANNPGFDLYEPGPNDRPKHWVEVKAMTGSLEDRPVCMSRAQFDCAWINGEAYSLYVVEHADDQSRARILKVRDPAGKAKNFTFDRGWGLIAEELCRPSPPDSD